MADYYLSHTASDVEQAITNALIAGLKDGTLQINLNADLLDSKHAGNADGDIPISNGTLSINLNADKVDGYDAGNSSGQIPVSNSTKCIDLNSDKLDGADLSTDTNLGTSDVLIPSQNAVKSYVDASVSAIPFNETLTAEHNVSTINTWEDWNLLTSYGIPANTLVFIGTVGIGSSTNYSTGVRTNGSSIDRRMAGNYDFSPVIPVVTDSNGIIEIYAGTVSHAFHVLGYIGA